MRFIIPWIAANGKGKTTLQLIRKMTDEYAGYLFDESRTMGRADYIAFPTCEEELADVVRWCDKNDVPLTAQGAMTGLAGGASPERGLALNLTRMNKILGLREEGGNYYLRVQPGLLLTQLRRALASKAFDISGWSEASVEALRPLKPGELFFPPDPTEPTASLGGMAACNACGARMSFSSNSLMTPSVPWLPMNRSTRSMFSRMK